MSERHPIIAITGSSGAGTTSVTRTFENIFRRERVTAAIIEGDSFHRYDRKEMKLKQAEAEAAGNKHFSHFGPENNLFAELEQLFHTYGESGTGRRRKYLHDVEEAAPYGQEPGTFTPWEEVPANTDLLFYEGLHGAVITPEVNVARHPDLLIGVVPVINLEWIQKLWRDKSKRGYSTEAVTDTILRRMPDYVHYITPQFAHTHVNFQRVPCVDTSNPFIAREIPAADESFVVIRFANPKGIDFPYLLNMIGDSFMSRAQYHRRAWRQDGVGDAADLHAVHLAHDGTAQACARGPVMASTSTDKVLRGGLGPTDARANALRALAMDAVQQANSGHPGAPMGMAEMAVALWTGHLRHNPANPQWADRDRFVLSNGHASMLLYALLHLSGYALPMDEIKRFRKLHSKTPGHPESGLTPGVETTTGPLGQGLTNAVGFALAEKMLAAEFTARATTSSTTAPTCSWATAA